MLRGIGKNNQGKAELTQVQCRTDQDKVIYSEYCPSVQSHHTCLEVCFYTSQRCEHHHQHAAAATATGKILNSREFTPAIFKTFAALRAGFIYSSSNPNCTLTTWP